jgi:hypothetical protein
MQNSNTITWGFIPAVLIVLFVAIAAVVVTPYRLVMRILRWERD